MDSWSDEEAVAYLRGRMGQADDGAATSLARALGGLPLALAQAAAFVEAKGIALADYAALFETHRLDLLERHPPDANYPATVATTWDLSLTEATLEAPAAEQLLILCSFLAPEDIPIDLLAAGADELSEPLGAALGDALAREDTIGALRRYSLLERAGDALAVHRMVQEVGRARAGGEAEAWRARAVALVAAAFPSDGYRNTDVWPRCARLLPHALAGLERGRPEATPTEGEAWLLLSIGSFFGGRGQPREAREFEGASVEVFRELKGEEHPDTLASMNNLALTLRAMGDLAGARELNERTLEARRRALGGEHPDTSVSAWNLLATLLELGDHDAASLVRQRDLAWLLERDPDSLGGDQRTIQENLRELP